MIQSVEDYLAAWNAKTADARYTVLQRCMTTDAIYVDPHLAELVVGIAALQALMTRFRERFSHTLVPAGSLDSHHHFFRLGWRLQHENGEIFSQGLMVGDLTPTGMIQRVVHFVD